MINRICQNCKKEFKTYPSRVKIGKGKYCSRQCSRGTLIPKGNIPWTKGKYLRMSRRTEFRKGYTPWNKGIKTGLKPKLAMALKRSYQQGRRPWNFGLKGFMAGKSHWNWKGGKSFEPYSIDWTETLKRAIRERDNYICQLCSQYGNTVHHIDYDKKNCNPDNLITLCVKCNSLVNSRRNYWVKYFRKEMVKEYERTRKKNP